MLERQSGTRVCTPGDVEQGVAMGDVERSKNQQQVILAIRDKVLANLPALVAKAGPLYDEISSGVHTNLSLDDVLRLADAGKRYPVEFHQTRGDRLHHDARYNLRLNGQTMAVLRAISG